MKKLVYMAASLAFALVACGPPVDTSDGGDGGAGGATDGGAGGAMGTTWYGDVLPIAKRTCMGCHLDGGIGPFSMERYDDVVPWADSIALAVETGYMPPWLPDETCQPLEDERRLTDAEIQTIVDWVDEGALEGDSTLDDGTLPTLAGLPYIDVTMDAGVDYTPTAQGSKDDYRCFILDPQLTANTKITGVNVLPGINRIVHHVLLYPADPTAAKAKDDGEAGPGWTCFGGTGIAGSELSVGGWAPGSPATVYPVGTGIELKSSDILVMQIHYNMDSGPPEPDRTRVELMFDSDVQAALMLPLLDSGFRIPAQSSGYSTTQSFGPYGIPGRVMGAFPHMHKLGQSLRVRVVHPDGSDTCVMDVPNWDFNWQQFYFYQGSGVSVAGTDRLELTCTWDNPTDRAVTWGDGSDDEMCLNYIYTVTN